MHAELWQTNKCLGKLTLRTAEIGEKVECGSDGGDKLRVGAGQNWLRIVFNGEFVLVRIIELSGSDFRKVDQFM
jgi:hypothetical protein